MYIIIKFSKSAFKHGFSEVNIRRVFVNVLYNDVLDEMEGKYLLIGFDDNGRLLEILYNIINDDTIRVFHVSLRSTSVRKLIVYAATRRLVHAMKCRNEFKALLNR